MHPTQRQTTQLTLHVPENLSVFSGHFIGDPLVPGAMLMDWIAQAISENMGYSVQLAKRVKFIHPVRPGDVIKLSLTEKNNFLAVVASTQDSPCLQGKFFYVK